MTDKLPGNLLALFQPRPPLRYLQPADHAPEHRQTAPISGVAQYLQELRRPDPDYMPTESWLLARDRKKREKLENQERTLKQGVETYNPENDPHIRGDPYKTLFVSRLSYDVKEQDLEREFGRFGPIDRIRLVRDKESKKPRGYAFILFEREKDMKAAFKETDGMRIKDRRISVDVERGRTTKGWKPRRLGGGLGGRGYTKIPAARPTGPSGFGGGGGFGGFRGGHGGFRGGGGGGGGGFGGRNFDRGPPRGGQFGHRGVGFQGGNAPSNAPSGPSGRNFGNAPTGPGGYDRGGPPRGGHDDRGHRDRMNGDSRGSGGRDRFDDRRDRDSGGGGGGGGGYSGRYDDSRKRGYEGGESGGDSRRRRY
ncbi:hypothetical protein TWF730_009742 [Orbilia blumenaviensis]|uniref:RRM domain-containing protein n=1 Tax=Orbilia blumenaviensis TaxID=1796055 RepID=A0AAV9UWU2_9PEZI